MHKYKLITPMSVRGSVKKAKFIEAYSKVTRNLINHPFETNPKVALKFLKNTFDSLEEASKIKEVQILKRLPPHPNIIKMIELLYDAPTGRAIIVFEYMESDLHVLNTDRPDNETINEMNAQNYFFQILKGIKHMHNCGIFHSHITPKNILISKDTIKIWDFSWWKDIFSEQPYSDEVRSVNYSAPEMILSKGYYDYKVDIWGAGWVFYELLKNKPLFNEHSEMMYLDKVHQVLGTPKQKLLEKIWSKGKVENNFEFETYEAQGLFKLLGHVSQEFQDMVLWLLTYDSEMRPSATTALKHPFFKELLQQDSGIKINQIIRAPQMSMESGVPKLRSQDLELRTQALAKAVSNTPLLSAEIEQGVGRQNIEETKEESKGDNAYSLERSKINKERASSKLLRSIQNNWRRISRRLVQRKLIPSTINLPKINTNSRSKRKSRQDVMQLSSNKIHKQRHAKLLPTHQINEGSCPNPIVFANEHNISNTEAGAISISTKIKSSKYLMLK